MKNCWKKYCCLFVLLGIAASVGAQESRFAQEDKSRPTDSKAVRQTVKTTDGRELKLVWNDEFEGKGLPDATKWSNEIGFVRNQELQYYTENRTENVRQEKGVLIIDSIKEQWPNPRFKAESRNWQESREYAEYTSVSIHTLGKASWQYGRIEVRAKLPKGKGIWPAIWMLGDNMKELGWPACGEIDIMEYVGKEPEKVYGTIHAKGLEKRHVSKGNGIIIDAPEEKFYTYILEWTQDRLDVFVDDTLVFSLPVEEFRQISSPWAFDAPFYLIINTAVGGSWGGPVDDDTCPARYEIDFVRVYQ